ncbi:hypothetical protein A3K64_02025 [Candidatus Micrarchaeota archaeon RBG_16_36_9]|nr:MAG: hypothetical protein A3K64_02025 [Candidatus Micrarchaeota archaeon RBG_16_36_9]
MPRRKNFVFRILLLSFLILIPLIYLNEFYIHFYSYISGNIIIDIINQQWHVVALNIILFMALLIPLSYRRKANWKEYGLVGAFFISLFIEMYGIPLTILFVSNYFLNANSAVPNTLLGFNIFGVGFAMDIGMAYGSIIIIIGILLIMTGWVTLYNNIKKKGLVTSGIYSYSRHPQYLGFIMTTIGWFVAWPTLITILFTPILIYKYFTLCKKEEKEISKEFPKYESYKENVPFLI